MKQVSVIVVLEDQNGGEAFYGPFRTVDKAEALESEVRSILPEVKVKHQELLSAGWAGGFALGALSAKDGRAA